MSSSAKSGGSQKSNNYYGTLAGAIGWGPMDWLTAIVCNGNYIWQCSPSGPLSLTGTSNYIDLTGSLLDPSVIAPGGYFRLYPGTSTQQADPALPGHSAYLDTSYLVAKHIFFGQESGTAPNLQIIGGRKPRVPTAIVAAADNIVEDRQVNPIAFLAEFLLDERGKGMSIEKLDAASWLAAAHWCAQDYAHRAYCFCSPLITEQVALRDIQKALLEPFNGYLRWTPEGKLGCFIYEWGIDPGGLVTLDARHWTKEPKFSDGDWQSIPTEVVVSFVDRGYEFQENTVSVPNGRARKIRQEDDQAKLDRKHVTRKDQALRHGMEFNRRASLAPGSGTLFVRGPIVAGLAPGDKIKVDTDPEPGGDGLAQLARIETIESDRTDEVTLTITLDPALAATAYTPAWTSPLPETGFAAGVETCPPITHAVALPLPPVTFGWPPTVGFLATRPSSQVVGFHAYFATNPSLAFSELGMQLGFAARCSLVGAVNASAGTLRLQLLDGADGPDAYLAADTPGGNTIDAEDDTMLAVLVQLDGSGRVALDGNGDPIMEFASVLQRSAINATTHDYTVYRGRLDVAARTWADASAVWIVPRSNIVAWDHTLFETLLGQTLYFRLAAFTSSALDESTPLPEADCILPANYGAQQPANYTITLSSEVHGVSCDHLGNVSSGELGASGTARTSLSVARDSTQLTAVASAPSEDQFSISLGTPVNTTATKENNTTVRADTLTANSGTIPISINIGGVLTIVKVFSLTKVFAGTPGSPGSGGGYIDHVFKRASSQPSTPTGSGLPSGWSDAPPAADGNPLWMSTAEKTAADVLVGTWATPIRLDGAAGAAGDSITIEYSVNGSTSWHSTFTSGDLYAHLRIGSGSWGTAFRIVGEPGAAGTNGTTAIAIFIRSLSAPGTPSGDNPSGWSASMPDGDGPVWQSNGNKTSAGALVGSWSTPRRISGSMTTVGTSAPTGSIFANDIWIDTSVAGLPKIKAYVGSAWVLQQPDVFSVVGGVVIINQAAIGAVSAGAIQAGEVAALQLAVTSGIKHPSYTKCFRSQEFSSLYNGNMSWAASTTYSGGSVSPATFYGPSSSSTPTHCPNSSGIGTFLITARIVGYTGNILIYYRKNGGSFLALGAASSDDNGNAILTIQRQIAYLAPTDVLDFYVGPYDGNGSSSAAVNNKYVIMEVQSFNWL
ncbi:MAG: hypothetical protein WC378_14205 [Opitutaceae bacterium]|jgi:hypothetical protein